MTNKEEYLRAAFYKVVPLFHECGFPIHDITENLKITCIDIRGPWAGYCRSTMSDDYYPEEKHQIVINNFIDNGFEAIEVLIHEVCHAIQYHLYLDDIRPHGKEFRAIAEKVGLTGRMTQTYADEDLKVKISEWEKDIGEYPHQYSLTEKIEGWIIYLFNYFGLLYFLATVVNYNTK